MKRARSGRRWSVINQSQSPEFQRLLGELATELGPCSLLTGMPFPVSAGSPLHVVSGPPYDRRGLRHRASAWSRFMVAATAWMALHSPDFVLVTTNPPMLPHFALAFRRLIGLRYALLVWDIYPEHLVHSGWFSTNHPLVQLWRLLNRHALRNAEVVITLGERMAETLRRQAHDPKLRVVIIPSWGDTERIRPTPKEANPFAQTHEQLDKLTVMYSGNLGASHGLESLLDAAFLLRSDSRIHFLIIGDGLARERIASRIKEESIVNVTLLDRQPWELLPSSLAAAEVAVISQHRESAHLSVPSKTYNAMAAGSALLAITPPESDLGDLVRGDDLGAVCAPDDVEAIVRALKGWLEHPQQLEEARRRSRRAAEERFNREIVYRSFLSAIGPAVRRATGV